MADEVQLPRLVVPGDIIFPKGRQKAEVVRGVSIVVHMADGTDVVYEDDDEVRMAPGDTVTVSMEQVVEAHKREIEAADREIERAQNHLADLEERQRQLDDLRAQREERQKRISEEEAEAEGE